MSFSAYSLFILFPRLLLIPLLAGCQGRFAEAALRNICLLFQTGEISRLINDSHDAQTDRVSTAMNSTSTDTVAYSKTARAALLAGAGEVGRVPKVAFTYGLMTDPLVATEFLKKLTLQSMHAHIAPHISSL